MNTLTYNMRKLLIILFTLFTAGAFAQSNPNSAVYAYQSITAAIKNPKKPGWKVDVMENGKISHWVTALRSQGFTPDSAMVWAMADSVSVLVRDISQSQAINVSWFGMRGDGVTDNYKAYKRLVSYVNRKGGNVTINFDPGTYIIDTFKRGAQVVDTIYLDNVDDTTASGPTPIIINDSTSIILDTVPPNNISNMEFFQVRNVKIIGYGATISVKGNFQRRTTRTIRSGTFKISALNTVCPLMFTECKNITVEGLELDGNADLMTQDALPGNLIEGDDYGLRFLSCDNVTLKSLYIHHFATDGLIISSSATSNHASTNVTAESVTSRYNGRMAFTAGNLFNATFTNCDFSYAGDSLGLYPGHAPRKGVDIEPSKVFPTRIDMMTSDIHFNSCQFVGNVGGAIGAAIVGSIKDIYVNGGVIDNTKYNYKYPLIMGVNNFTVENAAIYTGSAGLIYPVWSTGKGQRSALRNNIIHSKSSGIQLSANSTYGCIIEGNYLIGEHDSTLHGYFPNINARAIFRNNTIFLSKKMYGDNNRVMLQNAVVEGNTFQTDLDTVGGKLFTVSYAGSRGIRNERYVDSQAIKPFGSKWDFTAYPYYTKGVMGGGTTLAMESAGKTYSISWGTGSPNTGNYNTGDIIIMVDPASAGFEYYRCTVGGEAGVSAVFEGRIPTGTAAYTYKSGFAINSSKEIYVGDSTKLFGSTNRLVSTADNTKGAVYVTGGANETGIILFKNPYGFSNTLDVIVKGTMLMRTKGTANFTVYFHTTTTGTYTNSTLNISGDTAMLSTKVRLLKDASSNGYLAFFDTTTTLTDKTIIKIDKVILSGTSATMAKAADLWTPSLITSLSGYTVTTLTNSAGTATGGTQVNADWNATSGVAQILNKPTLSTVATTGSYTDLSGKPAIQAPITLTTTGTSGAATFTGNTLNIPQYAGTTGAVDQTYSLGFSTNTGTLPSSPVSLKYSWSSDGRHTTLKMRLKWANPATNVGEFRFALPAGMPAPKVASDIAWNGDIITAGLVVTQPSFNVSYTISDGSQVHLITNTLNNFAIQVSNGGTMTFAGLLITLIYENQ